MDERSLLVDAGEARLAGDLAVPEHARGLVLFAHGSGSSRRSPRNRAVAAVLHEARLATLLFDLLTPAEEKVDLRTRELRFDIGLLAGRLVAATDWAAADAKLGALPLGYFGASTGAAAALVAGAERAQARAVVSRGGRPDLAGDALDRVLAPTLLLVGGRDDVVLELNRQAMARMRAHVELGVVPGATHLFDEPGTLEEVARLARRWFERYL
jgi:dienelactone hydrolase